MENGKLPCCGHTQHILSNPYSMVRMPKLPERSISTFAAGFFINWLLNLSFARGLCMRIIYMYEPVCAAALITLSSIIFFGSCLFLYDWYKVDIFFIERLKAAKEGEIEPKGKIAELIVNFSKKFGANFVFFYILTVNPFLGTIYFRTGFHRYNGLSQRKDVRNFSLGIILTVTYIFVTGVLLKEILFYVGQTISQLFLS